MVKADGARYAEDSVAQAVGDDGLRVKSKSGRAVRFDPQKSPVGVSERALDGLI